LLTVDLDPALDNPGFRFAARAQAGARHHFGDPVASRCVALLLDAAETRAWNGFLSAVPIRNSGCHCTPMQKGRRGSSMPSMTPSAATALTTTPGPTAFTAW